MRATASLSFALFSAVVLSLLTGCATGASPKLFPQYSSGSLAVAPLLPSTLDRDRINGMAVDLFVNILRNDLIVDSSGPQTADAFRLTFRGASHVATSVSHGYGMLMLTYMAGSEDKLGFSTEDWILGSTNLKDYFDAMLRTVLQFPSAGSDLFTGLLVGYENRAGGEYTQANGFKTAPFANNSGDSNSITDGDMDIIYSLILADRQWGSRGPHNYIGIARKMLAGLWENCVQRQHNFLLLGDWVNDSADSDLRNVTRTSSFMLSHLVAFKAVDSRHNWGAVIDACTGAIEEIRNSQNALGNRNGLLPDLLVFRDGGWEIAQNITGAYDNAFAYNAVTVPWRLGTSYMLLGNVPVGSSTLYDSIIKPLDDFARTFTGGSNLSRLGPLQMNGTPIWADPDLFVPPFAVTASVAGADQRWVDTFWGYAPNPRNTDAFQGLGIYQGDASYYGDYVRMLVLLAVSGNYWMP